MANRSICLCLGMTMMSTCVYAYLPTYHAVQEEKTYGTMPFKRSVSEVTAMVIEGETVAIEDVGAHGGPIRYYFSCMMPRVKGEPLFSKMTPETTAWMGKNMPLKISGRIKNPNTAHDKTAKMLQDAFVSRLETYKEEIGKLYNEYKQNDISTDPLQKLCTTWNKISSSRYWKLLRERQPDKQRNAIQGLYELLGSVDELEHGNQIAGVRWVLSGFNLDIEFDKEIQKAYSPIIDVKLARYAEYKKSLGLGAIDQDQIDKANRVASRARMEARKAKEEAAAAKRIAEEAELRAISASSEAAEANRRADAAEARARAASAW